MYTLRNDGDIRHNSNNQETDRITGGFDKKATGLRN